MIRSLNIRYFYLVASLFLIINSLAIAFEFYYVPIAAFVLLFAYIGLFHLNILLYLIVFFVPISINLASSDIRLGLSLPAEPLIIIALLVFITQFILRKNLLNKDFIKHPFSIIIYISVAWIFFTSVTSQIPLVSFKYLISRIWFLVAFYFLASVLFFQNKESIKTYLWCYILGFLPIITYTIIHHSMYNFRQVEGHWVMYPFFNDHTSYAAMLAMFTPFIISSLFDRSISLLKRRFISLLLFYFIVAIVLSYTRAAWLSLIVALGVFVMIYYKIKFRTLLLSLLFVVILILGTKDQVMRYIEQNNTESSSDYLDHIKSAYNINSDVSNVERINRWMAAFRMFAEKPFVGFGPGTYQFEYAPFQKQDEKTRISTNAGDRGNAHSEYIGPLAETGIIGGITFMILVIVVLYKGIRIYQNTDNQSYKLVSLSLLLGLITYFVHGTLNNFLDTDKASCPFWGFIAMLAVIDILNKNKKL